LTVRSPILTGLFWAIAGIGRFAANAAPATPFSKCRRVILEAILAFLPNGFFAAAHAKASRAARRAATWCGKRRSRGGLLAHLQEGAAVAGIAKGDKEDRRPNRDIDEIERDGLEEEIGAKIALKQHRPHPLEHIG